MSLPNVNNKPTFQSTFQTSALLDHTLSFLDEDVTFSLQGINRAFNLRRATAVNKKLNEIQDKLIKLGFLEKENRIAFEAEPTAIKNVSKELDRGIEEIAKKMKPDMLFRRIKDASVQNEMIQDTTLRYFREREVPYAEKLGVEYLKQQKSINSATFFLLSGDLLKKNKPFLALYAAERIDGSNILGILQQNKFCEIAEFFIKNGQIKTGINLLKRMKDIGGNLEEMNDLTREFKAKFAQSQALDRACVELIKKGYKKEAIENYQKYLNTHLSHYVGDVLFALIQDGADNATIFNVLRSCSVEKNREALKGVAVKALLQQKKFDQLVGLLEDKEFTVMLSANVHFSEDQYVWNRLNGYYRTNWSRTDQVAYNLSYQDENLFLQLLQGQELINFLSKFTKPTLRGYLLRETESSLRKLKRNQEAIEVRNLIINDLEQKNQLQGTKEASTDKHLPPKQQIKDPVPPQTKETSVQVPQASSSVKTPPQPVSQTITQKPKLPSHAPQASSSVKKPSPSISQPKIPNEQSSSATAKKESKSCCLHGKDFVAAYWKQFLVFRIFSFLTFGLLPLITFLVGCFCRRQEVAVR